MVRCVVYWLVYLISLFVYFLTFDPLKLVGAPGPVALMKCWHCIFLQTTDTLTFVCHFVSALAFCILEGGNTTNVKAGTH